MCVGVSLTKHSNVDAGRGCLVLDTLVDMADVVSTLGNHGMREHQAGSHVHGQHVCQLINVNNLEDTVNGYFIITLKRVAKYFLCCKDHLTDSHI